MTENLRVALRALLILAVLLAAVALDLWIHIGQYQDCRVLDHSVFICVVRTIF